MNQVNQLRGESQFQRVFGNQTKAQKFKAVYCNEGKNYNPIKNCELQN